MPRSTRARIHVVESEELFDDPAAPSRLLSDLGLPAHGESFPALNATSAPNTSDMEARDRLRRSFAADNEALFALLGRRLWVSQET